MYIHCQTSQDTLCYRAEHQYSTSSQRCHCNNQDIWAYLHQQLVEQLLVKH